MWKIFLFLAFAVWTANSLTFEDNNPCEIGNMETHFVNDYSCCPCYFTCFQGQPFPRQFSWFKFLSCSNSVTKLSSIYVLSSLSSWILFWWRYRFVPTYSRCRMCAMPWRWRNLVLPWGWIMHRLRSLHQWSGIRKILCNWNTIRPRLWAVCAKRTCWMRSWRQLPSHRNWNHSWSKLLWTFHNLSGGNEAGKTKMCCWTFVRPWRRSMCESWGLCMRIFGQKTATSSLVDSIDSKSSSPTQLKIKLCKFLIILSEVQRIFCFCLH